MTNASDVDISSVQSDLIPGGLIIYYADGDEEILHANQYVLDLFECETFDEFMEHVGGSFRGFVEGSDIDAAENSIWGQVEERNGLDHIYYQIRTKTGKLKSVDDYGRLVQNEGERPVFYVFVVEMGRDSVIDWLTGLPGMERFSYVAEIETAAIFENGGRAFMLVFDIMGMKSYNSTYGRTAGDQLLCDFANALRSRFASELCCRYAGDSFCTLVSTDDVDAAVAGLFSDFAKAGLPLAPPVMAGAYELAEGDELAVALDRAKLACDTDRATWESHLSWYTDEMRRRAALRVHVLEHLDHAIAVGWIVPYYQGIVRSATGRVCGVEALARWNDPMFGRLAPEQFVPVLEEAGLIGKLDMHIVDCVLAGQVERRELGKNLLPVSVNVSLSDLASFDLADALAKKVDAAGVPRELLRVEFSKPSASREAEMLRTQIKRLHDAGFEVWLDDFGSGFSSLNSLKDFDFDLIKLDISFLNGGDGTRRFTIVDSVIRTAKRLGVRTLAEGVETVDQAKRLTAMGCDALQGFFFCMPEPMGGVMESLVAGGHPGVEPLAEQDYWNRIGAVNLGDLSARGGSEQLDDPPVSQLPVGVLEIRDGAWHVLRATEPLIAMFLERGVLEERVEQTRLTTYPILLDEAFYDAVDRCELSGSPERIAGPLEYGSGFMFSVRPLCHCEKARAYVATSVPTALGSALGLYGDVPVAYAVFRMIYDEGTKRAVDAEYVYANRLYRDWGGFTEGNLIGKRFLDIAGIDGPAWLALCDRSATKGESVHEVIYSNRAGHWLSYNITPSLMEGYCIFAFVLADAEQQERQELIEAGMRDALTTLLNRRGIDVEMNERMNGHPGEPFVLILLDVDDFKTVNDLYGHDVGDEALRSISRTLLDVFPEDAIVGRNGGDEILVALFGEEAGYVDAYLSSLMSRKLSCKLHDQRYALSVSAGYAWYRGESDLKAVYTRADEALYAVKLAGKGGYKKWTPDLSETPQRSLLGFTTRELAEGMPLAMLAHRPDGEILFANEGLARLLGYGRLSEVLNDSDGNLSRIVLPTDWPRVERSVEETLRLRASGGEYQLFMRMLGKEGILLHVTYRARVISTEEKGVIIYAYIVSQHMLGR